VCPVRSELHQVEYDAAPQPWAKIFPVDPVKKTHHFAWLVSDGQILDVVRVKRTIKKYHPELFCALEQEIEAEDENGTVYKLKGYAIAMAQLPAWPNLIFINTVYK
jgi:hypothetical protein